MGGSDPIINLILIFIVFILFLCLIIVSPFCVIVDFELISLTSKRFNFILLIDIFRVIFLIAVILISTSVFIFRFSYIKHDKFFNRFHVLLFSFIFSIIILI